MKPIPPVLFTTKARPRAKKLERKLHARPLWALVDETGRIDGALAYEVIGLYRNKREAAQYRDNGEKLVRVRVVPISTTEDNAP